MQTTTIFLLITAIIISFTIAFYQYLYKTTPKKRLDYFLFSIRGCAFFLLFLLLINPQIKSLKITDIKPVLSILADNSLSIRYFNHGKNVSAYISKIKQDKILKDKFDIKYYSFGENITELDSLSFNSFQTNISNALDNINDLTKDKIASTIIFTDGNQTIGNDYEFLNSKQPIYPVIVGDTTQFQDISITQLNVNKYSYLKNQFPVETFLFYDGKEPVNLQFNIRKNGKVVFRKNISFSSTDKTKIITANLTSEKEGVNYYSASISQLNDEKNTTNNSKSFSVEVIDEQTNVLILSSFLHPDIGALKKAIESNKQRKVSIELIDNFKNQLNDFQLVIFYQPNNKFKHVFEKINTQKSNFLLISGAQIDWNFINNLPLGFSKKSINQTEEFGATFNKNYLTFLQKDIGFEEFPPLKDVFGEVNFEKENQTLLFQNINGIQTKQPLLTSLSENNQKKAVLFGEGIWKWRAASFMNQNNFQDFDEFIGNIVQFLASNKKRNRLEISAKSIYAANETVTIAAFYVDENYQFDNRADLWFSYTNTETKETKKLPFSLQNNSYTIALEDLKSGEYSYVIYVDNQNVKKYGKFKISDYNVEEQFTNANKNKLEKLAINSNGKLIYPNKIDNLLADLIKDKRYFTTQKSEEIQQNLIDWKWILALLISLLTTEWFTRKYFGKI